MPRRSAKFSSAEISKLIESHLPAWRDACDADADTILVHEGAFGASPDELMLLACALKYAAYRRKNVHVMWRIDSNSPHVAGRRVEIDATFRETESRRTTKRKAAQRSASQ